MPDLHVRQRNGILWLILDTHPRNHLTTAMLEQLSTSLHKACQKPPRLIVLTGTGEEAFATGIDQDSTSEQQHQHIVEAAHQIEESLATLRAQNIPTVAVIKGLAQGAGCELAVLCETIFAREDAVLRLPSASDSIFPGTLLRILPALPGKGTMERLVESAETLNARQALQLGLVHQVLPTRRFLQDTEELLTMLVA
ncbi:enoyl-CoA hydratase/isomerase family protein [Dictyobacter arantiisoli]|uniref:Enoyl-CoA hydratase n=1 Tax=Dictyobacter arantiisoli TaxID=2014874 RepID=A0A5A5T7P4_9CHLR|nr:enoyl-CoA hydratase/isomerase family protein [Dictyobacter arantiisoli]GCF07427.1 hypothetical protein KDI_09910 [Dictyobacter arantiisoli]